MINYLYKKGDVMYTEDDKYTRPKFNNKKAKINNKVQNNYNTSFNDNFYEDYYDNYVDNDNHNMVNSYVDTSINSLDTSYTDDYSEKNKYQYNSDNLFKKKYIVIIIILTIVLAVLIILLIQSLNISTPPVGDNSNYVRLYYDELELNVGDTKKLEITLSETSEKYKIEWFSNNDNVITVDNNGNIRAINEGEAIVLVAYYVSDKVYDAQCHIYVSK